MKRLDFETLFRIVRWDYNRCFKNESLDKDLFVEKYGRVMGEHYYNKFIHEFDGNILKMIGYFRGSEKEGQVFCDMIIERIEKYEKREPYNRYDGLITKGAMGSICGMATSGDIEFDRSTLWTDVYDRDKNRNVRKAIEEEKKFLAEKIIKAKDSRKINIIKRYLSEYEYLLDEMPKHDFKPFERVLVRRTNQERWKLHLFSRGSGTYDEYECLGGVTFSQCIPYEGNEHLLGTNKNF